MGIKASYYSHVTNARVWSLAGRPTIPSQQRTSNQLKQLATCLVKPPDDPIHHVELSPGCKDRVKYTKGLWRGHPQRYWLEINLEIALPILKAYVEYTAPEYRYDALGIKHMLNKDKGFRSISGDCAYAPKRPLCTTCKASGKRMAAVKTPKALNPRK